MTRMLPWPRTVRLAARCPRLAARGSGFADAIMADLQHAVHPTGRWKRAVDDGYVYRDRHDDGPLREAEGAFLPYGRRPREQCDRAIS
jgi:hypothetical protein